jgi:heme exporter protein CcmD
MNFDLGEYASYIGPAYAVTVLALGGMMLWAVAAWRAAKKQLAALESRK